MTTLSPPGPRLGVDTDRPVTIPSTDTRADQVFRSLLRASGTIVLILLVLTGAFLAVNGSHALDKVGFGFFTSPTWDPTRVQFGVGSLLLGSIAIALVAVVLAFPVSLAAALMINEYAPVRLRAVLVSIVDVLACVPSIIYGFWGLEVVTYIQEPWARWICDNFGFVPIFRTPPLAGPGQFGKSIFATGLVCSLTLIPIITSVSREVMAQAPRDACEAALGLGGTRWGMVTNVILPFSRNGIVGAGLLALGRGLGETMIVALMLSAGNNLTSHIMGPNGLGSIAAEITNNFVDSNPLTESALIAAGLCLFLVTLLVGAIARVVLVRSSPTAI
jgi:phosphate transport system permease protein